MMATSQQPSFECRDLGGKSARWEAMVDDDDFFGTESTAGSFERMVTDDGFSSDDCSEAQSAGSAPKEFEESSFPATQQLQQYMYYMVPVTQVFAGSDVMSEGAERCCQAVTAVSAEPMFRTPAEFENKTTVMIRNLPFRYSQDMLVKDLNESGFTDAFDFVYLPMNSKTDSSKGYAFVNFSSAACSWNCKIAFEGRPMMQYGSDKVLSVVPAAVQGYEANYEHFAGKRVSRSCRAWRPLFLRQPPTEEASHAGKSWGTARRHVAERDDGVDSCSHVDLVQSIVLAVQKLRATGSALPVEDATASAQRAVASPTESNLCRFCTSCGSPANSGHRFCSRCGTNLVRTDM